MAIYLIATTRLLPRAVSGTIKGESSAGKNYLLDRVLELIPDKDVIHLEAISPRAPYYLGEGLKRKVVVLTESDGSIRGPESFRWLISENKLRCNVTIKDPQTGQFKVQQTEVAGPTSVITTTTATHLKHDDENRTLSLEVEQSEAQTRLVLQRQAEIYNAYPILAEADKERFRAIQAYLRDNGNNGIVIPFAAELAEYFPDNIVRVQRDFPRFLDLIASLAFIFQYQRKRTADGKIIADARDYYYARFVASDFLYRSVTQLPAQTLRILEAIKRANPTEPFSREDIQEWTSGAPDWVRKWIGPLHGGPLKVVRGGQGAAYQYRLDVAAIATLGLPEWDALRTPSDTSDAPCRCVFPLFEAAPTCLVCGRPPSEASGLGGAAHG